MQLGDYPAKTLCSLIGSANSLHYIYSLFDHIRNHTHEVGMHNILLARK